MSGDVDAVAPSLTISDGGQQWLLIWPAGSAAGLFMATRHVLRVGVLGCAVGRRQLASGILANRDAVFENCYAGSSPRPAAE
jgi:hypothetical protein